MGDVNGDGVRDATDAQLILDVLVTDAGLLQGPTASGLQALEAQQAVNFLTAGDMNADRIINNLDSILILGELAGLIAPPPDNTQITVTDNGDGTFTIAGAPGAVPGGSTVNVFNAASGESVAVMAAADGSFSATLAAQPGDRLVIDVDGSPARIAVVVGVFDDFETHGLDPAKWATLEFVRGIDPEDGVLELALARHGTDGSNTLRFADPDAVTAFQADVTIGEFHTTLLGPSAGAKLVGFFYNDGTPGGGKAGEVLAEIGIRLEGTNLVVAAFVGRCDDPECASLTPLFFDNTTFGSVAVGETHTLSIGFSEGVFVFGFDGSTLAFDPTALAPVSGPSRVPFKGLSTDIQGITGADAGAFIEAEFDNVLVNGVLYDDFSSDHLDRTKWADQEAVRVTDAGLAVLALGQFGLNTANPLHVRNPGVVTAWQGRSDRDRGEPLRSHTDGRARGQLLQRRHARRRQRWRRCGGDGHPAQRQRAGRGVFCGPV
ncbi:MAG: hypothetical protein KatS3mg131_2275 [Candidatus Tectimicrobiota bacterium]|nr:MAG: hypothetical protein KatS3mg131_2275 [Candidatus Tectomicrobia bacterium]